nr:TetR/AcrR family transcriptional regulator [Desulfobotulus pelophilus]
MHEFAQHGYGGASINRMVERAGIAKGSVFQYFGDKEGIFAAVFSHSLHQVKNALRRIRDDADDTDIFNRIERVFHTGLAFTQNHPLVYRLYTHLITASDIPQRDLLLSSLRSEGKFFLGEILQAAMERGEIRSDLPMDEALFLLEAVMDRFLMATVMPCLESDFLHESSPKDRVRGFIRILRHGMAPEKP